VLGYTQAFSSIGGLLVAIANGIAISNALDFPSVQLPGFLSFLGEVKDVHAPWRYTLMSGLIPAIPLIVIRPFLPESPSWAKKLASGTLRRPSVAELFSPQLRRTTIVTTIMFACSFAAAFGAIQQMPQIVPGLPQVQAAVEAKVATEFPEEKKTALITKLKAAGKNEADIKRAVGGEIRKIAGPIEQAAASTATKVQEVGGLVGRFLLAVLVAFVASRRTLLRIFLLPGLIIMPIVFGWAAVTSVDYLHYGIFVAGLLTVAQFSFWGNYLPHVYPVHLRGTGESFAANIGGRLIGTSFAAVTQTIATWLTIDAPYPTKVAYTAAGVAFTVYLINVIASFFLPEPKGEMLE
jgi:hypothetical protein